MPLKLEIVTPEKRIFSDTVDGVVIPGMEGEAGLLPNHAPIVTTLKPGELRYRKDGKEEILAVGTGFIELSGDQVNVITDLAVSDEEIDEAMVQEALDRAQEAIDNKDEGADIDIAAMQAIVQKSMAQLNLKRRRKSI